MLTMLSKHFTFECQSQIKRHVKIFDDSSVSDQDVSEMPMHQIRFDDGIYTYLRNKRMQWCGVAPPTNNFGKT